MTGGFSAMEKALAQPSAIGTGYDVAPTGLVLGGGGGALWGRVWLGGKGFGLFVDAVDSNSGTTSLSGGGGGGELGYAVVATDRWLVVPFFGLGGFGYTVKVQNQSRNPMPIYANETIPGGAEAAYTAGFLTGELGVRVTRLLPLTRGASGKAGLVLGAELGYMSSLQRGAWESNRSVASPESAELRGGYFRLVIGGGGFQYRSHGPGADRDPPPVSE